MKDFFGQEIKMGDSVALTPHGYKDLVMGTVIDFTPQKVRVSYMRTHNFGVQREDSILRDPSNLVKAPD